MVESPSLDVFKSHLAQGYSVVKALVELAVEN